MHILARALHKGPRMSRRALFTLVLATSTALVACATDADDGIAGGAGGKADGDTASITFGDDAIAVELLLVQPLVAYGGLVDELRELQRLDLHTCHVFAMRVLRALLRVAGPLGMADRLAMFRRARSS